MIRLPISGLLARWRPATGYDDLTLIECPPGLEGAVRYVARCVTGADNRALDAPTLAIGDLDWLIMARRRDVLGDGMIDEGSCPHCRARVDVRFSLAAFAEYHRPRRARSATPTGERGWWRLSSAEITFRAPTVADVLTAVGEPDAKAALLQRCVRGELDPASRRSVERAMARVAPTLRADVAGSCPDCGAAVTLDVDVREVCLSELRFDADSVLDEVHLLASTYHWSHRTILGLPSVRRGAYADLISGRSPVPRGLNLSEVNVG
ncbi:hypothetical protein FK531_14340 [Rhodococcus spelaei]|uniref:Uncharacterized protein n=1 Tax=Rhodococcus spelaei TaxID=2546320 RepID=A0A541B7L7_9NOCA|nr:hypothetical protein [Rhodococcus spelaei]TQF68283.1 hypothetical protein FK531_14340 [Rhodococcus spelaei]